MDLKWKYLFRDHILSRGYDYYIDDSVNNLSFKNDEIRASVIGNQEYEIEIAIKNGEIWHMDCDCPYSLSGYHCKHMAAVLYTVENMDEGLADNRFNLEHFINSLDQKELKKYIYDLASKDNTFKNDLMLTFNIENDSKTIQILKKELNKIFNKYQLFSGYIDWKDAWNFKNDICRFIDERLQILIDRKKYKQAFDISTDLYNEIADVDVDDSDGELYEIFESFYNFWKYIYLESNDSIVKKQMLEWFKKFEYTDFYAEQWITNFLIEVVKDADILIQKIEQLDEVINDTENNKNDYNNYILPEYVIEKIHYMELLNKPIKEIEAMKVKYWNLPTVREMEINQLLLTKDYEDAISILEESKKLDQNNKKLLIEHSKNLISIYQSLKEFDTLKKELYFFFIDLGAFNFELYQEYKKIYDKNNWLTIVEKILANITYYRDRLMILAEEEMNLELLRELDKAKDLLLLDLYATNLISLFPKELINLYITILEREATIASRENYQRIAQYLRKLKNKFSAEKEVNELLIKWRTQYKNRPAMMQELKRV